MVWQSAWNPLSKISFSNWCLRSDACVYVHVHTHTPTHPHTHTPVLKSSCICDHFSSAFWHSCRALLWWLITREDSALERQNQVEKLATGTMTRHQQQCISWKRPVWDLSKAPSLWTSSLDPGLRKAFHKTLLQQISFANVERKTQGMKFLMSHACETAEKQWIRSHLMYYVRRRQWHPTPLHLPGRSHGWRSLVGCSPWGR